CDAISAGGDRTWSRESLSPSREIRVTFFERMDARVLLAISVLTPVLGSGSPSGNGIVQDAQATAPVLERTRERCKFAGDDRLHGCDQCRSHGMAGIPKGAQGGPEWAQGGPKGRPNQDQEQAIETGSKEQPCGMVATGKRQQIRL